MDGKIGKMFVATAHQPVCQPQCENRGSHQGQPLDAGGQRVQGAGHGLVVGVFTRVVDPVGRGADQQEHKGPHRACYEQPSRHVHPPGM
ncbi:MAG: hypothetical protein HYZ81_23680 [Nitrospinae bacterium]|nr:hypothetical protein [Nitrospinota bacterium]